MTDARMIDYPNHVPDVYGALADIETVLSTKGIDIGLNHLVKLRASQMNNCGFCVKMHTSEARRDGETNERLDRLVACHGLHFSRESCVRLDRSPYAA